MNNINNRINNLQTTTCTTQMTRIFDYIKGKTLNDDLPDLPIAPATPVSKKWYKLLLFGTSLIYTDISSDNNYGYAVLITTKMDTDICNHNPVKDCKCIFVATQSRPGSGATATAIIDTTSGSPTYGQVTGFTIVTPGSGYIDPPDILLSGVSGTGANAVATIGSGGAVTGITVVNGGSGYTTAPTVTITNKQTNTIPDYVINDALNTLPVKTNWILFGAIGVGVIIGLYFLTRKK